MKEHWKAQNGNRSVIANRFTQKIATIFKDFSRTTYMYQECIFPDCTKRTFPVHSNRILRLELFAPPTSLHFSVHLSQVDTAVVTSWIEQKTLDVNHLLLLWAMIHILSWTTVMWRLIKQIKFEINRDYDLFDSRFFASTFRFWFDFWIPFPGCPQWVIIL